jgi:HEAT repeat protein
MGNRGGAKALAILSARMTDADKAVAGAAIQALGKLATPQAMAALKTGLGKCPCVAQAYLNGAGKVAASAPSLASAYYAEIRAAADHVDTETRLAALRGEIVTSGEAGLKLWLETLASADGDTANVALRTVLDAPPCKAATAAFADGLARVPWMQTRLAAVLALRRDKAAVPALAALADGEGADGVNSRLAAAAALATLNDPAAIPPLLALSKDADAAVAEAAKNELMGFAGLAADDAVLAMLANADGATRLAGIDMAMRRRMASAVPSLAKLTADADANVRGAAIKGVGDFGTAKEIPVLLDAVAKDPEGETPVPGAFGSLRALCAAPCGKKNGHQERGLRELRKQPDERRHRQRSEARRCRSITIQSSGRLCKWDGFSEDPAPGKSKALRMVYTFDGTEKSVQVRRETTP